MSLKKKSASLIVFSKNVFRLSNVLQVVFLGILLAVLFGLATFKLMNVQRQEATLLIAFDDESQRMFQGEVVEGMTVFQALVASSRAGQIKFKYSLDSKSSVVIEELNGYTKTQDKKLVFYLNNSRVNTRNINSTYIKGGDKIEIRYE